MLVAERITNILLDNATADVEERLDERPELRGRARSASTPCRTRRSCGATFDDTARYLAGNDPEQVAGVVVALQRVPLSGGPGGHLAGRGRTSSPMISDELRDRVAGGRGGTPDPHRRSRRRTSQVPRLRLPGADQVRPGRALLPRPADHRGQDRRGHPRSTVVATGVALVLLLGAARRAGHPAGGQPGTGGRPDRAAALRGPARPADGGQRRGRPGPARRLVQPDGDQPAAPDRPAGGDVPAAAAVHLRRLARAAYAADHGTDGRRPDLRRAGRVRPGGGPQRRAAPGRARPVRGAAHRPAGDQPVRRRLRHARRRADRPGPGGAPGGGAARRPRRPAGRAAASWTRPSRR